jgi:hypothetical protein
MVLNRYFFIIYNLYFIIYNLKYKPKTKHIIQTINK